MITSLYADNLWLFKRTRARVDSTLCDQGGRMPVAFLTDDQAQRSGRYSGEPTVDQWARFFYLDDGDRALVLRRREDHVRLGFALQLGTVRFLGTFLPDPTAAPPGVVTYMSRQLPIDDPSCLPHYLERRGTHHDHARDMQRRYGYRDFHAPREVFRLVRWLYTRAWLSAERPSVLFDLATARLVEHKVLLPVAAMDQVLPRCQEAPLLHPPDMPVPCSEQRCLRYFCH